MRCHDIYRLFAAACAFAWACLLGCGGAAPKTCSPEACRGVHPDIVKRCPDGTIVRYECLEAPDTTCQWRMPPCPGDAP
jgi:hypothetical protein